MLTEASSFLVLVPGEIFMALTNLSEQMIVSVKPLTLGKHVMSVTFLISQQMEKYSMWRDQSPVARGVQHILIQAQRAH